MYTVVVGWSINPELIIEGLPDDFRFTGKKVTAGHHFTWSGSSLSIASHLDQWGVNVNLIGAIGPDSTNIPEFKFTHKLIKARQKTPHAIIVPGQGSISFIEGTEITDRSKIVSAMNQKTSLTAISGIKNDVDLEIAATVAQEKKIIVCGVRNCTDEKTLKQLLTNTRLLILSEPELSSLPGIDGESNIRAQLLKFTDLGVQTIIVTRSANGSIACAQGEITTQPIIHSKFVNGQGAGDCFAAGIIFKHLIMGDTLPNGLKFAAAAASLQAEKITSSESPNLEEITSRIP